MDKKRAEQVILIVLIPVFLVSLLVMRAKTSRAPEQISIEAAAEGEGPKHKAIDDIERAAGPLNVSYSPAGRDPFKDLLQEYIQKMEGQAKKEAKDIALPRLNIEGLIWNSQMPQAIINGRVVKIGDTIEGVKVIKIEKEGITVEYKEVPVFISKK